MQIKQLNADGSTKSLEEYNENQAHTEPQTMIDDALTISQEGNFAIIGEHLDLEETRQEAKVVAAPGGILVFQNVLDS